MTTENHPADPPAATDETASLPFTSEQSPAAEASPGKEPTTRDDVPAEPQGTETAEQPPASPTPPRRVRLNPTVLPDVAKAIPSLPPTAPPPQIPPAAPRSTPATTPSIPAEETVVEASIPASPQSDTGPADSATQDTGFVDVAPPPRAEPVAIPGKNESLDADLEAELEAAMSGSERSEVPAIDPAAALDSTAEVTLSPESEVKKGTRLTGTVASIHGDDMFLDFGLRIPGVLSRRQFGLRKQPMQGETLEVVVSRVDENEGLMHVNLPTGTSKVRGEWDALVVDQNVECFITGVNKGGLEVSIGAVRGFMPASQVEMGFVPDLNVYVGQKVTARISEVNPKRRKLVLSRRVLLEEEREHSQHELLEKIEPGQQYTGRVRTIKDYGAFVDIGGADGLLHVAQISWSRINHPSEVLTEGEEIEVQVLSIDKEKKKISLGMRQLTQNPWKAAQAKYSQGATVHGKVTRIEPFGAFIELEDGVEGLVHISELDHKRVNKVAEVLRLGQEVDVQVLEVDPKKKRISLSLKALKEKPEEPHEKETSAPVKRQRSVDSLVGGMGEPTGGKLFGDPSKFGR